MLLVRAYAAAPEAATGKPLMDNAMFCYQCEQTSKGTGCTTKGERGLKGDRMGIQQHLTTNAGRIPAGYLPPSTNPAAQPPAAHTLPSPRLPAA